ncbi:hypothetical protein ASPZODRAFT_137250 [Penicilliopsis zonata CBS 506.65]|uniref:Uncharacterized protein n=1 Tax=Penicilliopsis zonata CBS 506.65 TaxID=1073090 RepID=A0A1L9S5J5_9EURO|nr:hypothetical protein ASPZODRAFT_137250 [Penicilliopsis zonata CBS 506.65]OJJ42435.1 hypothetical protein ASPZODRAFT_137250 [Penicilliopsis zonata CBS 506.65]
MAALQQLEILVHGNYPPALLDAVAETHPRCRVSVFPLCSFSSEKEDLSRREWVQSPVLHAVQIICYENHHQGIYTEHPDRVLRDLLYQSPHIKRLALQISSKYTTSSCHAYARWLQARPREREEVDLDPTRRARLEVLSLPLITKITASQFLAWSRVTDLGCLTAWTAGAVEDVSLMTTIADLKPFRALERLTLALYPPENSSAWLPAVEAMFDALPPLGYLCLLGTYDPAMLPVAVLDRHGATLAELKLHRPKPQYMEYESFRLANKGGQISPIFPADVIARMAARCPSLHTLRLCVQRYRGHPVETAAYEALGLFPALRTLHLVLNCLPVVQGDGRPFPPRELSAYELETLPSPWQGVHKWKIRDCAINSAFDEPLAVAIFMRIQTARRPRGPLRLLRLHPLAGQWSQYEAPTGITPYARLGGGEIHYDMAGQWEVECEADGRLRADNRRKPRGKGERLMRHADVDIFQSIWPSTGSKIWPLEWQSWPLSVRDT